MHESKHYNQNNINQTFNITNSSIKEKRLDMKDENFKMNEKTDSYRQVSQNVKNI